MNISLFLTQPKIKKIFSKNSELISIITSPITEKRQRNTNLLGQNDKNKINKKFETSRTKVYSNTNLNSFKIEINNSSNNIIRNRYSKQI